MFNPATMLPGAVPPPRKQENAVEATFDKPASENLLETSGRVSLFIFRHLKNSIYGGRGGGAKELETLSS